jgi:chromate reductase
VSDRHAIQNSDGVLFGMMEAHNGIPGPFKNAIDWGSRAYGGIPSPFSGKPFGVIGYGATATYLAQGTDVGDECIHTCICICQCIST